MKRGSEAMLPRPFRIERVRKETHDTFTFELSSEEAGEGFTFRPGQFNMLYVFGMGEVPISISGDPAKPRRLVHTARSVGTVTRGMGALRKGDSLGVRGPFGTSWPVDEARGRDVVIVAGGIGLAPLRPVLYAVAANRKRFGRVFVLYGSRTPADLLYVKEMEKWRKRFRFSVDVTVDTAAPDWEGHVGVVTRLIPRVPFDPSRTTAMICGPEVMMRFTIQELLKRDMGPEQIHVTMERNMQCGIGHCGHCQYGPLFVCKDGPVFRYDRIQHLFTRREL
jgi:NAD(P)H-flavin reductase